MAKQHVRCDVTHLHCTGNPGFKFIHRKLTAQAWLPILFFDKRYQGSLDKRLTLGSAQGTYKTSLEHPAGPECPGKCKKKNEGDVSEGHRGPVRAPSMPKAAVTWATR